MKHFEEPIVEITAFSVEDIIAVSGEDTPLKPNQSPWG